MRKQAFVDQVASRAGMSRRDASKAVDAFLETITDTLVRGDSVAFTGFGKFSVAERATRTGVNPQTGDKILIPARKVAKFSAARGLRSANVPPGGNPPPPPTARVPRGF